jgi:hypothetical protein
MCCEVNALTAFTNTRIGGIFPLANPCWNMDLEMDQLKPWNVEHLFNFWTTRSKGWRFRRIRWK